MEDGSARSRNIGVGGSGRSGRRDRRQILRELPCRARSCADSAAISAVSEGVRGYALDPNNAEALWKKSEEMVGEKF